MWGQKKPDVWNPRGDERQIAVVVRKGVHDDGTERFAAGATRTERAAGVKNSTLLGEERCDLFVQIPVAGSFLGCRRGRQIFGKVECESADELSVRAVHFDG